MKVVINTCYGGFGLSDKAIEEYGKRSGLNMRSYEIDGRIVWFNNNQEPENIIDDYMIPRNDPNLVSVVEDLGEESWGVYSELKVVEIPDDVSWEILDYDGVEMVSEVRRFWL